MYSSIKSCTELIKNAASDNKNVILENLENLKELKVLNIDPGYSRDLIVSYALKWIEVTNDVNEDQSILNQPVKKDPETSRIMLEIIKKLGITDEKLVSRINFLIQKFPDAPSNQEIV
mmetsp:Transcript_27159/g.26826  ORF Transcript_27159/g.26826 Transcript_27159/m.26826 type:complete len:118 (+) Transcript_27159:80-433(+)